MYQSVLKDDNNRDTGRRGMECGLNSRQKEKETRVILSLNRREI